MKLLFDLVEVSLHDLYVLAFGMRLILFLREKPGTRNNN
jgi:hypothetical protein